jgi:hypothetical protein
MLFKLRHNYSIVWITITASRTSNGMHTPRVKHCKLFAWAAAALASALLSETRAEDYWGTPSANADADAKRAFVAVDAESIVEADGLRSAWVFFFVGTTREIARVTGIRYSLRCGANEQAERQHVEYDPMTLTVQKQTQTSQMEFASPVPQSVQTSLFAFICTFRAADIPAGEMVYRNFMHVKGTTLKDVRAVALQVFSLMATPAS